MPTIAEVRAKFPQYDNMSDDALATALHQKFYSDMPEADFRQRIGLPTTQPTEGGFAPRDVREAEPSRDQMKAAYQEEARGVRDRQSTVGKYADTAVRGLARAIPFAGDAAALGDYLTGNSQTFQEAKDKQEAMDSVDDTDRPVTSYGSQIAGGLALPGGKMLQSGNLAARIGKGAAIGAGYGVAYGAGTGTDLGERAGNAISGGLVGGVAGGAVPAASAALGAVGRGARRLAEPILGAVDPNATAQSRAARAIAADTANGAQRLDPQDFAAARANGQDARVVDTGGENTKALLRSAANTSPDARQQAVETLADRFHSQGQRFADFLQNLPSRFQGNSIDDVRDALTARARQENGQRYERARQEAEALVGHTQAFPDGLWTPELDRLAQSDLVQSAMNRSISTGTNEATVAGQRAARPTSPFETGPNGDLRVTQGLDPVTGQRTLPTLDFWDQVQRNLRSTEQTARRTGDDNLARQAGVLRSQLVDHLDQIVPSYQEARQGAARFFGAQDALEAGENYFNQNGRNDIAQAQRAFARFSPAERELFQHGFTQAMSHASSQVGDNANITGRAWVNSPLARQKMALGLGAPNAQATEAQLLRERIMDRARTALGNSTTARQLVEMGLAGGVSGAYGDWSPTSIASGVAAGHFAGRALNPVLNHLGQAIDGRVSNEVMQILMSDDPAVLQRVIQRSQTPQRVIQALRRIESAVGRGAQPALSSYATGDNGQNEITVHPPSHADGGLVKADPNFANELLGEVAQRFAKGGQPNDLVSMAKAYEEQQKVMGALSAMPRRKGKIAYFGAGGVVEDMGKGTIPVYKRGGLSSMSKLTARTC